LAQFTIDDFAEGPSLPAIAQLLLLLKLGACGIPAQLRTTAVTIVGYSERLVSGSVCTARRKQKAFGRISEVHFRSS